MDLDFWAERLEAPKNVLTCQLNASDGIFCEWVSKNALNTGFCISVHSFDSCAALCWSPTPSYVWVIYLSSWVMLMCIDITINLVFTTRCVVSKLIYLSFQKGQSIVKYYQKLVQKTLLISKLTNRMLCLNFLICQRGPTCHGNFLCSKISLCKLQMSK